jgi:hypothetical protein
MGQSGLWVEQCDHELLGIGAFEEGREKPRGIRGFRDFAHGRYSFPPWPAEGSSCEPIENIRRPRSGLLTTAGFGTVTPVARDVAP